MDLINSGVVAHCNIPTDTDDFGRTRAVMKLLEATITTFTGSYADWAYSAGGSFGTESACPWDQSQFADRLGACSHNALLEGATSATSPSHLRMTYPHMQGPASAMKG